MFERASVRVNPKTPVRVEIGKPGHPTALGVVSNISDQGACVVTDGNFPVGESLVLQLVFAPDAQPFQAAGRVVWIRPAGEGAGAQRYGLQWAHRTGPQHARLRELIGAPL
ncbi:MAG TPA: PilZ domain-containing protein [Vicinamibacteria bacterium]|nr:PilZ domain-containing protein [Vicinamibacteria bacterium]